jgi:hypothetical protein
MIRCDLAGDKVRPWAIRRSWQTQCGRGRELVPFSILLLQAAFINSDYLMATALTSLKVVRPRRTFWTPSCMRVVIPSLMAFCSMSSVLAFV